VGVISCLGGEEGRRERADHVGLESSAAMSRGSFLWSGFFSGCEEELYARVLGTRRRFRRRARRRDARQVAHIDLDIAQLLILPDCGLITISTQI
jgi:hypothetical protein